MTVAKIVRSRHAGPMSEPGLPTDSAPRQRVFAQPSQLLRWLALPALLWSIFYAASVILVERPVGPMATVDFSVYYHAAELLASGQSPYQPDLLSDSFDGQSGAIYFYPPAFAWWLIPLTVFPLATAALIWLGLGAAAIVVGVFWTLRSIDRLSFMTFAWTAAAAFIYFPVQETLRLGNVSALLLASMSLVLAAGVRLRGAGVAAGALIKIFPAALALPLLLRHGWPGLRRVLLLGLLLAGPSLILHPEAWIDFAQNSLFGLVNVQTAYNNTLSPAGFAAYQWPQLPDLAGGLRVAALAAALGLLVAAGLTARRSNGWPFAVTATILAALLIPGNMWSHYGALLVPSAIVAFARAKPPYRVALLALLLPLLQAAPFFLGPVVFFLSFWMLCALILIILWPYAEQQPEARASAVVLKAE